MTNAFLRRLAGVALVVCAAAASAIPARASFNNTNLPTTTAASTVSESMSVTAPCTPNCAAFVWVGTAGSSGYPTVTVTYGGNSMTSAGSPQQGTSAGSNVQMAWFYLVNPPTGSNTLAISTSGGSVTRIKTNLIAFNNVNQSTPVRAGTYTGATGSGVSNPSLVVSSDPQDLTVTATLEGQHVIGSSNQAVDGIQNNDFVAGSDHALVPASSVTHTWDYGAAADYILVGFSIQGASAFTPVCSGGACVVNQCPINYWASASAGFTCTMSVGAGHKIVAFVLTLTSMCPNFSFGDSLSLTYSTKSLQCGAVALFGEGAIVFATEVADTGSSSGSDTFTLTNPQFGFSVALVEEISGLSTFDTSAGSNAASGTSITSGNLTTAQGAEYLINGAFTYGASGLAVGSGFVPVISTVGTSTVSGTVPYGIYSEAKVLGAAGTYAGTFTGDASGNWADVAAAFGVSASLHRHISIY
jgi:hypothetical protein